MPRLCLVMTLAAGVAACTGSSYTIEGDNIGKANERAARYCSNRDATAQLEHVQQRAGGSIETYRCIALE